MRQTTTNMKLVSGVKDSGPEKNFLIPTFSNIGNLNRHVQTHH